MPLEMVPGRSFAWSLLNKLGEGDAGEVFWVESLLDKRKAILKRPVSSAFTSDVIRQAVQIDLSNVLMTEVYGVNPIVLCCAKGDALAHQCQADADVAIVESAGHIFAHLSDLITGCIVVLGHDGSEGPGAGLVVLNGRIHVQ